MIIIIKSKMQNAIMEILYNIRQLVFLNPDVQALLYKLREFDFFQSDLS